MTIYQILITKYQRLFTNEYQISTKDYVRIYKLFMQNKANFRNAKNVVCACVTMRYGNLDALVGKKTNPIQTQYKANLTQNKPNLTQFKANSNPIKPKINPIVERANRGYTWKIKPEKELNH